MAGGAPLTYVLRGSTLFTFHFPTLHFPLDTLTAIHARRSVRPGEYADTPIDRTTLNELVSAANAAPSHRKTYPWRFVVFDTASAKTELGDYLAERQQAAAERPIPAIKLKKTRQRPGLAAAAIAIVMNPDLEHLPEWEEVSATASAVQNLWLAATAKGLVGYWSSPGLITSGADDFLGLAEGEKCLGIFYLGHPKETPAEIERPGVEGKVVYR